VLSEIIESLTEEISEQPIISSIISDVIVTEFSLGKKPPKFSNINVNSSPPELKTDTIIDFNLSVKNSGAKFRAKSKIIYKGLNIEFSVKLQLEQLAGPMKLIIPPYPISQVQVCFLNTPIIDLTVLIQIGSKKGYSINLAQITMIHKYINDHFSQVIHKKMVHPVFKTIQLQ